MDEMINPVEYLDKLIGGLDKCINMLNELKTETGGTRNELKNNGLLEYIKTDKKWEELMLRFKRIQMVTVEAQMNYVLSIIRQEAEKLEEWLKELKSQLEIGKGGKK